MLPKRKQNFTLKKQNFTLKIALIIIFKKSMQPITPQSHFLIIFFKDNYQ